MTEESNGFMQARKINIQLRRILGIRVADSHVKNIRHKYLNYNYRRSKCKPHEFDEFEKRRRLLFAINNINNNMETTVFVDECSCWTLCERLYFMRRKSSHPKCNTISSKGSSKVHIFGGITWAGQMPYIVSFVNKLIKLL